MIEAAAQAIRRLLAVLVSVSLLAWTMTPTASHVPTVIQTLQDHAEIIVSHGHAHDLEEDLIWALHGHSHDAADHDHAQAILMIPKSKLLPAETSSKWRGAALAHWSSPFFRLERPPRV